MHAAEDDGAKWEKEDEAGVNYEAKGEKAQGHIDVRGRAGLVYVGEGHQRQVEVRWDAGAQQYSAEKLHVGPVAQVKMCDASSDQAKEVVREHEHVEERRLPLEWLDRLNQFCVQHLF